MSVPTNLRCAVTIVEAHTIVFREAREILDHDPVWQGKRFATHLPKRTAVANAQGNQQFILDLTDYDAKRALSGITKEFLGKFPDV